MIQNIEEVDLLGPAHLVAELVAARGGLGEFDFIVSSHNFEHLPNPIGFLQACSQTLRSGGILSMAIPDKRTCFDYFRPLSTLGILLEAYADSRERPSITQHFDLNSLHCRYRADEEELTSFSLTNDPARVVALQTVEEAYQAWRHRLATNPRDLAYEDCHCWTFTPNSFRLLMLDLSYLRVIDFAPLKISDTTGNEFYAHLRNTRGTSGHNIDRCEYYRDRQSLLHAVNADASANAVLARLPDAATATSHANEPSNEDRAVHLALEVARLQNEVSAMRTSTCWKMTAPIRHMVDFLRHR
jgi:hypothetical protein